jgi:hypothetical protein
MQVYTYLVVYTVQVWKFACQSSYLLVVRDYWKYFFIVILLIFGVTDANLV